MSVSSTAKVLLISTLLLVSTDALAAGAGLFGRSGPSFRMPPKPMPPPDVLRYFPKAERVRELLNDAVKTGRLPQIEAHRHARTFALMNEGDAVLETCLRHSGCDLSVFAGIANQSALHREVVRRNPAMGKVVANHAVGQVSERVMRRFFTDAGWEAVPGEIGRQGIDGLFIKRRDGVISDVLVVESKYNSSMLQNRISGMQMSDQWIRSWLASLVIRHPERSEYAQITRLIEAGRYRAVLWKFEVSDQGAVVRLSRVISRDARVALEGMDERETMLLLGKWGESLAAGSARSPVQTPLMNRLREELDGAFLQGTVRH